MFIGPEYRKWRLVVRSELKWQSKGRNGQWIVTGTETFPGLGRPDQDLEIYSGNGNSHCRVGV